MVRPEVTVIDYGVGNLLSVQRGFEHCGAKVVLTADPEVILASQKIILPGVGAFPNAMEALKKLDLVSVIQDDWVDSSKNSIYRMGLTTTFGFS